MSEKLTNSTRESELRFSREQGFFDKSLGIRLFMVCLFALCLTIFLHFREVQVEVLELNSIAPHYIVAQIDFDFPDEEATIILKQEAVRDIGKIYKISEKQIEDARVEFENELLKNQEFRKQQLDKFSFETFYKTLDSFQKGLVQLRFTDPRTLQKMQEVNLATPDYQIYTPASLNESTQLPESVWSYLQASYLSQKNAPPPLVNPMLSFFKGKKWKLEEDIPAQRQLRKRIQADVPLKYSHVSAGSRIIDQGEKVTARHNTMLQAMKKALSDRRHLWHPLTLLGSLIMSLLAIGICAMYFHVNYPQVLLSNRKICLLMTIVIITLVMAKGAEHFILSAKGDFVKHIHYPLLVPFAAILVCNLMNAGVATFISGFLTVIFALALAFEPGSLMVMNLVAAFIAILSTGSLRRRQEIFVVCAKAWLGCAIVIFSIHFYDDTLWNLSVLADLLSTALFMLLTAVLVLGLLPLLESMFKIMSDVTLMEYMDPNHELLRRLSFEAPGTYQHTLVVCNIAEAAALSIGANGLFCRVASLYHDIGKMATPFYFTENQQEDLNVHQLLTPLESAQAIMSHVSEGAAMGRKANLPEQFIDIIKEHHGTTLVYFFYRKELDRVGGDPEKVNEKEFRYSGPKPRTKESAIIMIADSFEAASRSLDKIEETSLSELINRLIREKADDGQFDDCLLTFEELGIVKKTMVKTLVAAMHTRIKYPNREKPSTYLNS